MDVKAVQPYLRIRGIDMSPLYCEELAYSYKIFCIFQRVGHRNKYFITSKMLACLTSLH
jgi:hypothetical protein